MMLQPQIGMPAGSLIDFIACSFTAQEHTHCSLSARETAVVSSYLINVSVPAHELANIPSVRNTSMDLDDPVLLESYVSR